MSLCNIKRFISSLKWPFRIVLLKRKINMINMLGNLCEEVIRRRSLKRFFAPISTYIFITDRCNLSCSYCHYSDGLNIGTGSDISPELFTNLIESPSVRHSMRICLYGGEPLINKKWTAYVKQINNAGIISHLITNGVRLAESLPDIIESKLDMITISIHEKTPVNNLVKVIKKLNSQIFVVINIPLNEFNYKRISSLLKTLSKISKLTVTLERLQGDEFNILGYDDINNLKTFVDMYKHQLNLRLNLFEDSSGKKCEMTSRMMYITLEAKILPCCARPLRSAANPINFKGSSHNSNELVALRRCIIDGRPDEYCQKCNMFRSYPKSFF